jgi:hypothetical protein
MRDRLLPFAVESSIELDISDIQKVEAAEGHHMIGMYREAADEIASIPPERQEHPQVLHIACRTHWALRQMPQALACSDRFIQAAPNHPFGYSFKSMLLSYLHKPRDSYDLLRAAVNRFPGHATMRYDLAHAAAKCELWSEALHWLYQAISIQRSLKQVAMDTEAFALIRVEIEKIQPAN